MSLSPTPIETLARAKADLAFGLPVVLDGAEPMLALAAEVTGADRLAAFVTPETVLAITHHRAETLKARAYDGDLARIILPKDLGLRELRALADPATDLGNPLMGPFNTARGGDVTAHRAAIQLAKQARLLPAVLIRPAAGADLTDLHHIHVEQLGPPDAPILNEVVSARVPLQAASDARLHVFRTEDGSGEHVAIIIGRPNPDTPILTRLHSACFTGDLLGSLKCDCGPQLRSALATMGQDGSGVLLYLNQEGRGIGLTNKMRAYALQDQGFDTVDANHRLGFEDDERDFRLGAAILSQLGFDQIRLLTNNPTKIAMLEACGLTVTERVALRVGQTDENAAYLATKAARSGHLL